MNISFLIGNLYSSGGTQRMLTLLCNELVSCYSITIFVHQPGVSFFPLNTNIVVEVLRGNLLQRNLQIYKILKRNKSKYYINLDSNSVLFNGMFLPSFTKLIVWEHFSIVNNYTKWSFVLSRKYAVRRAYCFVLLSDFEINKWKELYTLDTNKAVRIYNPSTIEREKIDINNKYCHKTLLAIGNKIEIKGFDILLEAWKGIDTDWKLKIVGLGDKDIGKLQQVIIDNQIMNVTVYPKTSEIEQYYESASVFVLSSRREATPLVLIESQSFGLPAIVFNHLPGVMELIDKSALVADYNTPVTSLQRNILHIINDNLLYNNLFENTLNNSLRFNIESFKNQWIKLLEQ